MALKALHKNNSFGVGDTVRVTQRIKEGERERSQAFEGIVIGIKGRGDNRTFTVRRIGAQQVGIERIFPIDAPTLETIEVIRDGMAGVSHAKIRFIREKSKREIEKIYSRAVNRRQTAEIKVNKLKKKTSKKTPKK